jgi:mannose-1-phosphate guanylyltransferase
MKVVIFAGGSGRRLWPLSRKRSPKQFEPIIGEQSTLQLAVDRVLEQVGAENIFISTNTAYVPILREQLPMLPERNFIGEPMRRDLAAAVGLAITHMVAAADADEPIGILWGDNYMNEVSTFREVLAVGEQIVASGEAKIVFMGETPRFANDNLGWIGLGKKRGEVDGTPYFGFDSLTYRPELAQCQKMFAAGTHVWNTGYFITTVRYIGDKYAQHQPEIWRQLGEIGVTIGSDGYEDTLDRIYPELAEMSFDDAVLVHLDPSDACVLHAEMGWSDPGTLYALKEALHSIENENVTRGIVKAINSRDSLLYNYESDKVLAGIGLDGMIVVNTEDALLVVHKDQIPLVKRLVNEMIDSDLDKFT